MLLRRATEAAAGAAGAAAKGRPHGCGHCAPLLQGQRRGLFGWVRGCVGGWVDAYVSDVRAPKPIPTPHTHTHSLVNRLGGGGESSGKVTNRKRAPVPPRPPMRPGRVSPRRPVPANVPKPAYADTGKLPQPAPVRLGIN